MKLILTTFILSIALLAVPAAGAQESGVRNGGAASGVGARVAEEIAALERRWGTALIAQDTAALQALLAPEYTLTVSAAPERPLSRAAWFASLPEYRTRVFDISGLQVRVLDGVAVASFVVQLGATFRGADRSGEFFITDVWVRRGDRWQVAARYSSTREGETPSARALTGGDSTARRPD